MLDNAQDTGILWWKALKQGHHSNSEQAWYYVESLQNIPQLADQEPRNMPDQKLYLKEWQDVKIEEW